MRFVFVGIMAALVILWVVIMVNSALRLDSFKRQCADAGGHPYGSGLTLCLTDDGRLIEIYP